MRSLKARLVVGAAVIIAGGIGVAYATAASTDGPQSVTVTVHCGVFGQSVQQAINKADPNQPLTVNIIGTCKESVTINRDNVTLNASAPGAGIQAAPGGNALSLNDARRINLNQLTLTGGNNTLSASNGSVFSGDQLHINGASNEGVTVAFGSSGQLGNSVVNNAGRDGVSAYNGGSISVSGGTISNSGGYGVKAAMGGTASLGGGLVVSHSAFIGVDASFAGSIQITGNTTVETSGGAGVYSEQGGAIFLNGVGGPLLIENNAQQGIVADSNGSVAVSNGTRVTGNSGGGITAFSSSALSMQNSFVENNSGDGVYLSNASSAQIKGSTISGNTGDGIHLSDTSVGQSFGGNTVTSNGGWGVFCDSAPSVAVIHGSGGLDTVSGNSAGQDNCPTIAP
jgi:hypothetical protein